MTISRSVAHTPNAKARTSTAPSESGGSGTSSSLAEFAMPGETVIARILDLELRRVPPYVRSQKKSSRRAKRKSYCAR
jgi:hypothetical protein